MESTRDYYEMLGINKTATPEEIKKAYRKFAIKYHPDKNPDNPHAEEMFKMYTEVYKCLSDPVEREKYDRWGSASVNKEEGGLADIFEEFSDIFAGYGSNSFGGKSEAKISRNGRNLRVKVPVTLEEIFRGVEKEVEYDRYVPCPDCGCKGGAPEDIHTCPDCHGEGQIGVKKKTILGEMTAWNNCGTCQSDGVIIDKKCRTCHGEGRIMGKDTVIVDIPEGTENNKEFDYDDKGDVGIRGAKTGNLTIIIKEQPHDNFTRNGLDIYCEVRVNFAMAALGGTVRVDTIEGTSMDIVVEPGTQVGNELKVDDMGFWDGDKYIRGDMYIHINVWTPTELTDKEKFMMMELLKSDNFNPPENIKSADIKRLTMG